MSEAPYRPDPQGSEADVEIARLAARGERRILDAKAAGASEAADGTNAEERRREANVRVALGAYYGSPVRWACFAMMGVGVLTFVVGGLLGLEGGAAAAALVIGLFAVIGGFLATFWVDPAASRARVATERTWAESLPFALNEYFELLAQDPVIACRLLVELSWEPRRSPAPEIVRGVLGLWDAGIGVEPGNAGTMMVRGSPFVCGRYRRSSGAVYADPLPNRRLVARVHGLVDKVLLPLHRSHALARVSVRREVVHRQPWEPFAKA